MTYASGSVRISFLFCNEGVYIQNLVLDVIPADVQVDESIVVAVII